MDEDGKLLPFAESEPGATGLELLLPLTLKWAAEDKVNMVGAIARITSAPAGILGVAAGELSPHANADICVFDPEHYWKIDPATLKSQGKNTPFIGMELAGQVRYTILNGHVVHHT